MANPLDFMCIGGPAAGTIVPRKDTAIIRFRVNQDIVVYRLAALTDVDGSLVRVWVPQNSQANVVADLLAVYREHMATVTRPYFDVEY